ncbi:MAG: type II toxin-antitoxin system VapC family toxin [Actinomycetota bacterium]|nr:type II toxin-antitoxin system VapC family toxin [Actinomycetota bacterium]
MKLYVGEPHDAHVEAAVGAVGRPGEGVVAVSAVLYAEVSAALAAKARAGHITRGYHDEAASFLRRDVAQLYLVRPLTGGIVERAGGLPSPVPVPGDPEEGRYPLKGYDAIQLATALDYRDDLLERARQSVDPREVEPGRPVELHPEDLLVLSFDNALHDACVAEGIAYARPDRAGGRTFDAP